jgi:hypothetical protein
MVEVYEKIGRKYVKLGHRWDGFPCDGIWQVRNGRCNNTVLVTAQEAAPLYAIPYRTHRDDLCKYIQQMSEVNHRYSLHDLSTFACDFFAETWENQHNKG